MTRWQAEQLKTLLTPKTWCKGAMMALDIEGHSVDVHSEAACQWCLAGAIEKVFHVRKGRQVVYALSGIISAWKGTTIIFGTDVIVWNDEPARTLADVHALLDSAVE